MREKERQKSTMRPEVVLYIHKVASRHNEPIVFPMGVAKSWMCVRCAFLENFRNSMVSGI